MMGFQYLHSEHSNIYSIEDEDIKGSHRIITLHSICIS